MLNLENDINWSIFSEDEKKLLTQCYQAGDWQNLTCLPYIAIDNPKKEQEVQKMVLDLKTVELDDESEVKKEINDFWMKGEEMTPEIEADFQTKLNTELEEKKTKEGKVEVKTTEINQLDANKKEVIDTSIN